MGRPTASDPLGQRPDPTSFADAMEAMIDARIAQAWRSRSCIDLDNVPDHAMALELIARGWVVYMPRKED